MTLCPIAIVASCQKCPVVKVCPVKTIVGDYVAPSETKSTAASQANKAARSTKGKN